MKSNALQISHADALGAILDQVENGACPPVRPSVEYLTPQDALRYLSDYAFPHQRAVREHHVAMLARAMDAGEFDQTTTIKIAELPGGKRYLVDGQHRLTAVAVSKKAQTFCVLTVSVADFAGAQGIYVNTDSGMKRTDGDAIRAAEMGTQTGLSNEQARIAIAGLNNIHSGFHGRPLRCDRALRFSLLREWEIEARGYFDATDNASRVVSKGLRNSLCAAVGTGDVSVSAGKSAGVLGRDCRQQRADHRAAGTYAGGISWRPPQLCASAGSLPPRGDLLERAL